MKKIISILLAAVLIASVFAGCGKAKKAEVSDYAGMANAQQIAEYARKLEAEGNTDAAAQVWALLPDSAERGAKAAAENVIDNNAQMQIYEAMDEAGDIAFAVQGNKEE